MIVIIDYNLGNVGSIKNMLIHLGYSDVVISSTKEDIEQADKLILPGVGSFDTGLNNLQALNLVETITRRVIEDKIPILGICLGLQLMTRGSEEGELEGFSWFNQNTQRFVENNGGLKIPNMGWLDVDIIKKSKIFDGMYDRPRFYFLHSYHVDGNAEEENVCFANYIYNFAAVLEKDNIVGVQFHPEKSHKYGMKLFKNFIEKY